MELPPGTDVILDGGEGRPLIIVNTGPGWGSPAGSESLCVIEAVCCVLRSPSQNNVGFVQASGEMQKNDESEAGDADTSEPAGVTASPAGS